MTAQVALLRAINVGGNASVKMADLRQLVADRGLARARTVLQSGNLVFDSAGVVGSDLEKMLEAALKDRFGLVTDVLVRSATEWSQLIAHNPLPEEARAHPAHLLVVCLKDQPAASGVEALDRVPGPERVRAWTNQLFVSYPDGIGRSRLTMSVIERALGLRGTARNWNTVGRLESLLRA
ncbi:MAG TPA: DUF1697 domain-containing protein [Candidatus Dormibacteraeota bacterium]